MRFRFLILVMASCLMTGRVLHAQQRPLVTEDPESIGSGRVLIEGGIEIDRDQVFPVSGLHGDLVRGPSIGVSVGLSPTAEVQIDWGLLQRLSVIDRKPAPLSTALDFTGDRTVSVDDLVVATKVRLAGETAQRPAFGVRFGTKLPTAQRDKGIGQGTTDFLAEMLIGKTVQSVRTVGNVGLLVLNSPVDAGVSVRAMALGVSVARAVTNGFEVVGEINGHLDPWGRVRPVGTETRGAFRFGARYTYRLLRVDGGVLVGMTPRDPSLGLTFGATYVVGH